MGFRFSLSTQRLYGKYCKGSLNYQGDSLAYNHQMPKRKQRDELEGYQGCCSFGNDDYPSAVLFFFAYSNLAPDIQSDRLATLGYLIHTYNPILSAISTYRKFHKNYLLLHERAIGKSFFHKCRIQVLFSLYTEREILPLAHIFSYVQSHNFYNKTNCLVSRFYSSSLRLFFRNRSRELLVLGFWPYLYRQFHNIFVPGVILGVENIYRKSRKALGNISALIYSHMKLNKIEHCDRFVQQWV